MGVSKNRGNPPKWMVKIMETPIKMDDLGVPLFLETPQSDLAFTFHRDKKHFRSTEKPKEPIVITTLPQSNKAELSAQKVVEVIVDQGFIPQEWIDKSKKDRMMYTRGES